MKKMLFLFLFNVFLFQSFATEYFIDFQNGKDDNIGTNSYLPFKHHPYDENATGTASSVNMVSGDICYFKKGVTYFGNMNNLDSGRLIIKNTDGSIDKSGYILRSIDGKFIDSGVDAGDSVFINGEGEFIIDVVNSNEMITLRNPVLHTNETNIEYLIANYITFSVEESWGNGAAVIEGVLNFKGASYIKIDGIDDNGIEITNGKGNSLIGSNTSIGHEGIILKNLYIHHNNGSESAGIYLRNLYYVLIQNCEISYNGDFDSITGDDGIYCLSDCRYITIDSCNIHDNGDDGVHLASADRSFIQNCKIYNCGLLSGDCHPDGIATNSTINFNVVIRYNQMWDNRSHTDLEHINVDFYGNILFDTQEGEPGNNGFRAKLGANGRIYNNIFAWNMVGVSIRSTCGYFDVQNNIFYENSSIYGSNEINCNYGDTVKHNVYHRLDLYPQDKVIGYGASYYSVQEFKEAKLGPNGDNGSGSIANTPNNKDFTSEMFISSERSNPNFQTAVGAPQIDSGAILGQPYDFSIENKKRPSGLNWDIGAYEKGVELENIRVK